MDDVLVEGAMREDDSRERERRRRKKMFECLKSE